MGANRKRKRPLKEAKENIATILANCYFEG